MYFVANAQQQIVAEAHSFSPTEPPRWNKGDKVQFEVTKEVSGSELCICELAGGLWFVLLEGVSISVSEDGSSGMWISGLVTEIACGDPAKVQTAIKKYVQAFHNIVRINATMINDLDNIGNPPGGFSEVIQKLLDEGKRVVITGLSDGRKLEVYRDEDKLRTKEFRG